jgi:UV radiation resistance-associated gene protein
MQTSQTNQTSLQQALLTRRNTLTSDLTSLKTLHLALEAQRRRLASDISAVYPINPLPQHDSSQDEVLQFKIRGIRLPSTGQYAGVDEEEVACGLGWTAHSVWLVAGYLGVALRYPVQPVGSRSLIRDPVSVMSGSRTYQNSRKDKLTNLA